MTALAVRRLPENTSALPDLTRVATLPLEIDLPATPTGDETAAIPLIWARSQIADEMRQLMTPLQFRNPSRANAQIEARVTDLGLKHALATQWTSFVAVSGKVVNADPAAARDSAVPLPMVKGVGAAAYGQPPSGQRQAAAPIYTSPQITSMPNFSGSSTPEPETLVGLAAVLASLALARRGRRKAA